MKDVKKAAKDCALALLTGGFYLIVIFIRIMFTTPEGQRLVEKEVKSKIKAYRIAETKETDDDTEVVNRIGFV